MAERIEAAEGWAARPLQAWIVRGTAYLLPLAASFAFVHFATTWVRPPLGSLWAFLGWWSGVSVAATVVLLGVYRGTRRLLPLAALLKLSLIFPDETPSRLRTALRSGSVDTLEKRLQLVREARDAGTPTEAAVLLLELVAALNVHDSLTRGHSERVRAYSVLIGKQLGLDKHELELLNWAALLHDIGKLEVSQPILTKPGKPSEEEWQQLRQHPLFGELITAPLAEWLEQWQSAVGYHHERWDGKGYPRGLSGNEIPVAGRIVAVADVFDVITSARSYKAAGSGVDGRKEIARCAGTQFDPRVVRAFLNVSLGRMRLVMGPLSWLSHAPLLGRLPLTPALGTLAGATGILATAAASGALAHSVPTIPRVDATPIVAAAPNPVPAPRTHHSRQFAAPALTPPGTLRHHPSGLARVAIRDTRHGSAPTSSSSAGGSVTTVPVTASTPGASAPASPPSSGASPPRTPAKAPHPSTGTTSSPGTPASSGGGSSGGGTSGGGSSGGGSSGGGSSGGGSSGGGSSGGGSSGGGSSGGGSSGGGSSGGGSSGGGSSGGGSSGGGSNPPAAALLAFTAQPAANANVQAGAQITIKVAVEDSNHQVVGGDNATHISLGFSSNPGGGALNCSGGNSQTVSGGIAVFACSLNAPGSGYTITASTTAGLGSVTTNAFNVTAGSPAKLVVTSQPSTTLAGAAISPAVQVTVEDSFGNVVTADSSTLVTLALGANPGSGALTGTLTQTVSSGVATFANLQVNNIANGYTLVASSSPALGTVTSGPFNVMAAVTLLTTNSATPCTSGSSCTTASITPAPGATLLILAQRGGATSATDAVTSISGPLTAASSVASVEYPSSASRNYLFAWTATATASSGPVTVTFKGGGNANPTIVEVVELVGDNVAAPMAQAPTASGTSLILGGASGNLSTPNSADTEVVLVSFLANAAITTPTGFTKLDETATGSNGGEDYGVYFTGSAQASTKISAPGLGLLTGWGTIALEINHG